MGGTIKVLDDGFVRLVDVMGDDSSIVQAARVSYGAGVKTPEQDGRLIRFLMAHDHTSPFEMCEMKFHLRVPIFVFRQMVRHRTASLNEYSQRYSPAPDAAHLPAPNEWRGQATTNKQASAGRLPPEVGAALTQKYAAAYAAAREAYEAALEAGAAREQARIVLPLAVYTEAYWKIDLHNLFRFLRLRLAPDAQAETREVAAALFVHARERFPVACAAFAEHCPFAANAAGL